jgi:hypothetical protein
MATVTPAPLDPPVAHSHVIGSPSSGSADRRAVMNGSDQAGISRLAIMAPWNR